MTSYRKDFGLPAGVAWLNASHQAALPRVAAEAAHRAVAWKVDPREMTGERFAEVPRRLREALGRMVGAPADDVVLTNGASYGLHLLANGVPLAAGDEVLLLDDDFPSDLYPWLALRERGVEVRIEAPAGPVFRPEELERALTRRTRLVCMTWVHSFSGRAVDARACGEICRAHGAWLVLNTTQGVGVRPFDIASTPVDAVVNSGWKWLCGPYATGFAWIRPELRETLRYNQAYWLSMQTADDLGRPGGGEPVLREDLGARRYDVFGTANFFNFLPFTAAVEYLLECGVEAVRSHVESLVERLIAGLDRKRFHLASPEAGPERSSLVLVDGGDPETNARLHARLVERGVHGALRRGRLRFSPHLYNEPEEIDRALAALDES